MLRRTLTMMELGFEAHEWLLVIFFVNLPWLAVAAWARLRGRVMGG